MTDVENFGSARPSAQTEATRFDPSSFVAPWFLRNGHLMTFAGALWPRRFPALPDSEARLVEVAPEVRLRLDIHWQPRRVSRPTLLLVHGLEGSSQSNYVRGTAEKAWRADFNVVRMNVRNCGDTEHLTPSLYHSGLSGDVRAVAEHLRATESLTEFHLVGFSMGGNMVLKLAGEWGAHPPREVASVVAVCPSLDLARCADALELPANRLYQWRFVGSLKARLRRKARLFPRFYQADGLGRVRTVREFDDLFTAPHFGFGTAANYYRQASALPLVGNIKLPTLTIAAQDDPFIPFDSFRQPALVENPNITLLTPEHGGHVGFFASRGPGSAGGEDRYWAENRIVEFCRSHSQRR